jgi:ribosomal protein L37AE/L43A
MNKKFTKHIVFLGIGLTTLAAIEIARLYRQQLICPKCGGDEFSEFKPGFLTCRPCGHTHWNPNLPHNHLAGRTQAIVGKVDHPNIPSAERKRDANLHLFAVVATSLLNAAVANY